MDPRIKSILLFSALIFIFFVSTADACSCMPPGEIQDEIDGSSAIFFGKVIEEKLPKGFMRNSADSSYYTFEVQGIWKGPPYKTLTISTAASTASCGYPFEVGKEYLVFASGTYDDLSAYLCSRTGLISDSGKDLVLLGDAVLPTHEKPAFTISKKKTYALLTVLIFAIIVVIIRIIKNNKKRKKK